MRSDRLMRALLRLYPRAWRARYGDEFLALVAESGLSWRGAADIVAAAVAERVRAVAAVARSEDDPTVKLPLMPSPPLREVLAERGAFILLVSLTVWAFGAVGVPYPHWILWLNLFFNDPGRSSDAPSAASWSERLVVSLVWFATAIVLTALAWLTAGMLRRLGVPLLSDPVFYSVFGTWAVCAGFRMLYCMVQTMWLGSTWPGMHRREIYQWSAAMFLVDVALVLTDPAEALRAFWPLAMIFCMTLRPPFAFTRAGAAQRRANYNAVFGAGAGGPQPRS